jgi:hypothetical protein
MGLTRSEHDTAVELAIVELATAAGIDLTDESAHPGITAVARLSAERKVVWEWERTRGQREQDQRDDDWRRMKEQAEAQRKYDAERAAFYPQPAYVFGGNPR